MRDEKGKQIRLKREMDEAERLAEVEAEKARQQKRLEDARLERDTALAKLVEVKKETDEEHQREVLADLKELKDHTVKVVDNLGTALDTHYHEMQVNCTNKGCKVVTLIQKRVMYPAKQQTGGGL